MSETIDQALNISRVQCIPENYDPLFKLGLCYDVKKMTDESIKCFQKCIRIKSDPKVWQCLGQAYYKRGSHTNACKCLMKARELRPSNDKEYFEELLCGEIKFILGVMDEAEALYESVIKNDPDNVVALIGKAKIKLFASNEHLKQENLDEAKKEINEMFDLIKKIVTTCPDIVLAYNMAANCCIMIAIYMMKADKEETINIDQKNFNKSDLLQLARTHLLKALSLKDSQYLWYNLLIVYSLLFEQTKDDEYLKKALFCAQK